MIFKELFRIGALDTEAYAGDSFLTKKPTAPLDPKVHDRVKQFSDQALALSQARLDKNPDDVDALYARGVTRGMRATYIGIAEKAWFSALRSAVAARHDHERVLELDPKYVDAKVLIGTDLYIVGSLNWPTKMAASIVGISGNKQKGLEYLRQASTEAHSEVASDAQIVYALFLRREQKYDEALQVVARMQAEFPRNSLVAAEYAHLLNAAGHGPGGDRGLSQSPGKLPQQRVLLVPYRGPGLRLGRGAARPAAVSGSRRGLRAGCQQQHERSRVAAEGDPGRRTKCTTCCRSAILRWRNTAQSLPRTPASGSADLARHYMKQAYKSSVSR